MAISKSLKLNSGLTVVDAYIRVENITFFTKDGISFDAVAYVSAQATEPIKTQRHHTTFDLSGANPFVQAYEYLKTLPEFEGAADC